MRHEEFLRFKINMLGSRGVDKLLQDLRNLENQTKEDFLNEDPNYKRPPTIEEKVLNEKLGDPIGKREALYKKIEEDNAYANHLIEAHEAQLQNPHSNKIQLWLTLLIS